MKRGSGCCAVDIYCAAALISLSDSVSYITFLFSEWRIVIFIRFWPEFIVNLIFPVAFLMHSSFFNTPQVNLHDFQNVNT